MRRGERPLVEEILETPDERVVDAAVEAVSLSVTVLDVEAEARVLVEVCNNSKVRVVVRRPVIADISNDYTNKKFRCVRPNMAIRVTALLVLVFLTGCGVLRPGIPGSGISHSEVRQVETFEEVLQMNAGSVSCTAISR